tara:strand:+ start:267 stop:1727 length:1461 start_codon:yes stop_codon:yes gene_type:complete
MNIITRMPHILMACVLFSCSGDQHEVTPADSTNQGQLLFLRGDHVKAIEVLKREVADPASGVVPHRFLGRAFLSTGQYEAALGALSSSIETYPKDAELFDIIGAVHMTRAFAKAHYSDTDLALQSFTRALQLDPRRASTLYNLGLLYSYRDSLQQSLTYYTRAINADSTLAPAHKKLGLHYRQSGFNDSALYHLKNAARLAPSDGETHFHLGLLQRAVGDIKAAEASLNRSAQYNPHSPQIHFNLAQIYLRTGRRTEGLQALRRSELLRKNDRDIGAERSFPTPGAVAIGPATARYNMALNLALQGKYEQAVVEYQNALAINPQLKDAHTGLGILRTWQGDLDVAIRHFIRATELQQDDPLSHARLGMAQLKQKKYRRAERSLKRAAELDSTLYEAFYGLGLTAARAGQLAVAINHFQRAVNQRPESVDAHINLGVARLKSGDFVGAEAAYQQAAEIDPENTVARRYLRDIQNQLSNELNPGLKKR